MKPLNYDLKQICRHNKDGSFATQADRERTLKLFADRLLELLPRNQNHLRAANLKPKHIVAVIQAWIADGVSTGTLKNRMSALRWLAEKIGKPNIIARSNAAYGIGRRQFVTNVSKARTLNAGELARVTDPYTRMSLRLQIAFGLRREESIKIQPTWADRGDKLVLKASWTKGGREREIPINTAEQRQALEDAKQLAQGGSLIPRELNYKAQLNRFKAQCQAAGIHHVHGHRHLYAQQRYQDLTGWRAPACGGSTRRQLTPAQRRIDHDARMTVSAELGHGREQITAVYLGR